MTELVLEESPYSIVRVAVMRTLLIPRADYQKLMKMSLSEISNYLGETQYTKEITDLGVKYSGIELIEKALNRNYLRTIQKLKKICPESYAQLIDAYLMRNDTENIKTIIRGIIAKLPAEEIKEMLLPGGKVSIADSLLKKSTVDEVIASLPKPFSKVKGKTMFEIETSLDQLYFSHLLAFAKQIPEQGELFKQFLFSIINAMNILTFLRLRKEKVENREKYIFPVGNSLMKQLMDAHSDELIAKLLAESEYKVQLQDSLIPLEIALSKHVFNKTLRFQHQHPLSVYIILGYLFAKEMEIKNIRKIIQAKHLGLEMSVVEEQLVV